MLSGKNSATDAAQDLTKIYKLTLEQPECFPYWILLCRHGLKIKYNTDRACQMKIIISAAKWKGLFDNRYVVQPTIWAKISNSLKYVWIVPFTTKTWQLFSAPAGVYEASYWASSQQGIAVI